jgi:predicted nucleotidyltransferase
MKMHDREVAIIIQGGSHMRNLFDDESDMDLKYFVIPTFDDLYSGVRYSKQTVTDDLDTDVQDVRRLDELFLKANPAYLDLLFSPFMQKFGFKEIDDLLAMKDEIAKMNLSYLFSASMGMINRNIKDLQNPTSDKVKYMINTYGYNVKKAMMAVHLAKALVKFHATDFTDYKKAIWYEGEERDAMMALKRGRVPFDEAKLMIKDWEQEAKALEDIYKSNHLNEDTKNKIRGLLQTLVENSLVKES